MTRGRYAHLQRPRNATYDVTRPQPAAFLARLMGQALNHGLPARERGGRLRAAVGRRHLSTRPLATVLRALPRRESVESDTLIAQVYDAWPALAARSARLPVQPPTLSLLTLARSSAATSFVFGDGEFPLLLVKQARDGNEGVARETRFLKAVEGADIAPRLLGELDGAVVQEGMPGAVARVLPVTPADAHTLAWLPQDESLVEGLTRLATTTAGPGTLEYQLIRPMDLALAEDDLLTTAQRRVVRAARDDLARLSVTVVQHKDLSAQNWLVDPDGGLVGLVDWEFAVADGVPGLDSIHVAAATLEHGVGLTRWSDEHAAAAFRSAWDQAPLFHGARDAVTTTAAAAGVDGLTEQLCVGFFARRVGRKLVDSGPDGIGVPALAAMLRTVASS